MISESEREPGSDDDDETPAIDVPELRRQDAEHALATRIQTERAMTARDDATTSEPADTRRGTTNEKRGSARVVTMAEVAPKGVEWLWPGRLPSGMVAVLDGAPGAGKSTVALDLVARLTTGRPLPTEGGGARTPAAVVLIGNEDSPEHTIRPRLDAAGADLARRLITIRRSYDGPTKSSRHRTVPIPAELTPILKAWRLSAPWGSDGLVFPDDGTGAMVSENATFPQLALRTALGRAGLRRIRLHDLRHQSVAAFLMAGGSIYDASKNLGHASVAFTAAVYGHLSGDHRVAESDRLSFKIPTETTAKVIAFEALAERDGADLR